MIVNSPIGIFDSGLGGLTVAKQILRKLPQESIVYVGDIANIPYGEKTPHEIRRLALGISDFLIRKQAKMIIMACNVSSATSLLASKAYFPDTPIIGVIEAGARAAAKVSSCGPIGVLATTGTVKSGAYAEALGRLCPESPVFEQACPKFVPIVEAGMWDSPEAVTAVREYVEPLLAKGCRIFILGCTHYPFLASTILKVTGPDVTLIDPSEETAEEAANILRETGIQCPPHAQPSHVYCASASTEKFAELGSRFLGSKLCEIQKITWGSDLGEIECQEKMVGQMTNSGL